MFLEPWPKLPFHIPYLTKYISLPQLQQKENKVQITQAETKILFTKEKVEVSIPSQEKVEVS